MYNLLLSDDMLYVIPYLGMKDLVRLSQITRNNLSVLLKVVNPTIKCNTLIEYVALVSKKTYTDFTRIFLIRKNGPLGVAHEMIHVYPNDYPYTSESSTDYKITCELLKLERIDVIKKYLEPVIEIKRLIHFIDESVLSEQSKEYLIDLTLKYIRNTETKRIFNHDELYRLKFLKNAITKEFSDYHYPGNTMNVLIKHFIKGKFDKIPDDKFVMINNYFSVCADDFLCRIRPIHFDFWLNRINIDNNIGSVLKNVLLRVSDSVFEELIIEKYFPLLELINSRSAFGTIPLDRFRRLIGMMNDYRIDFDPLIYCHIALLALYLTLFPNKASNILAEIFENERDIKRLNNGHYNYVRMILFIWNNYKIDRSSSGYLKNIDEVCEYYNNHEHYRNFKT